MKFAIAALIATTAAAADAKAAAPACEIKTLKYYKEKGCKTEDKAATAEQLKTMNTATAATLGCKDKGKVKITCDATGISAQTFKEDECKGAVVDDDAAKATAKAALTKWGECTERGGKFFKVTGAKALMASTAVALAFVGSQF